MVGIRLTVLAAPAAVAVKPALAATVVTPHLPARHIIGITAETVALAIMSAILVHTQEPVAVVAVFTTPVMGATMAQAALEAQVAAALVVTQETHPTAPALAQVAAGELERKRPTRL